MVELNRQRMPNIASILVPNIGAARESDETVSPPVIVGFGNPVPCVLVAVPLHFYGLWHQVLSTSSHRSSNCHTTTPFLGHFIFTFNTDDMAVQTSGYIIV